MHGQGEARQGMEHVRLDSTLRSSMVKTISTSSPPSAATTTTTTMANVEINLPLPVLPEGWAGEKDFKPLGSLSKTNDRKIEPVGPHFLAYARRVRYTSMLKLKAHS